MTPAPHYTDGPVTLYTGDALRVLSELPTGSVDCVVTSPPFWGLRTYAAWVGGTPDCPHHTTDPSTAQSGTGPGPGHTEPSPDCAHGCGAVWVDGQYGLEPDPDSYVATLRAVFAQVARVLVPTGTVWLNLGDRYSANSDGYDTGRPRSPAQRPPVVVPHKNLLGMPWRTAFALQADGWTIRNAIVWHKPNAMPESVRDRLTCQHELLFLLTRTRRYHFDLDAIRVPLKRPAAAREGIVIGGHKGRHAGRGSTARRRGHSTYRKYTNAGNAIPTAPGAALRPTGHRHRAAHPRGKNPGDVWSITTRPLKEAHYAAFPIDIPLRCIAAGCPPGGTVLDPFSGAGTTGLAAVHLGRSYIGIDLRPDFHDIFTTRLTRQQQRCDPEPRKERPPGAETS